MGRGASRYSPSNSHFALAALSDEELLKFHQAVTRECTESEGFGVRGWYHCLYMDIFRHKRILDVGSGLGIDAIAFAKGGAHVTCLDIAESNLLVLRRLCGLLQLDNVNFHYLETCSSLSDLGDEYDVIWCQGSMINAPLEILKVEAQELLRHLKGGGRWIELDYPKARWEREGSMPFEKWGEKTDGCAPWIEWYDLDKIFARLHSVQFDVILHFEFHNQDFNWFDLRRTG